MAPAPCRRAQQWAQGSQVALCRATRAPPHGVPSLQPRQGVAAVLEQDLSLLLWDTPGPAASIRIAHFCLQLQSQLLICVISSCCFPTPGATISLEYSSGFDIELYRDRILHTFLSLPKNAGVQVAISKVHKPHTSPGMGPRSSAPFIQIVLMDKTEPQTGTSAEQLAKDIMKDVAEHGASLGIVTASMQATTGSNQGTQRATLVGATIAATAAGLFLVLLLLGIVLLRRKGTLRPFPLAYLASLWNQKRDLEPSGDLPDKGFDNPIFDTPSSPEALADMYCVEGKLEEMESKQSQLYYMNPLYDETELSA
ncbi:Protein amnionless [Varanus komodoensis]|nr:Protein amnionless [Varanus komodoensis]